MSVEGVEEDQPKVLSTPLTGGLGGGAGRHLQPESPEVIDTGFEGSFLSCEGDAPQLLGATAGFSHSTSR